MICWGSFRRRILLGNFGPTMAIGSLAGVP
jgi:hypothetical protein